MPSSSSQAKASDAPGLNAPQRTLLRHLEAISIEYLARQNMPGYAAMLRAIDTVADAIRELGPDELDLNLDEPHDFKVSA